MHVPGPQKKDSNKKVMEIPGNNGALKPLTRPQRNQPLDNTKDN